MPASDNTSVLDKLREIDARDPIIFIGSGLSGKFYSTWEDLVQKMCKRCGIVSPDLANLKDEKDRIKLMLECVDAARDGNETVYLQVLEEEFAKPIEGIPPVYRYLVRKKFKSYVTTNFDPFLEHETRENREKNNGFFLFKYPNLLAVPLIEQKKQSLFYAHGLIVPGERPYKGQVVLSYADFEGAYAPTGKLFSFMFEMFKVYSIIFVGYSASEPAIQKILQATKKIKDEIEARYPEIKKEMPSRIILLPMLYYERKYDDGKREVSRNDKKELDQEIEFQELGITVLRYDPGDAYAKFNRLIEEWSNFPSPSFNPWTETTVTINGR
jgi:hypothetical protein